MKIALITMSYNHDKNGMDNAFVHMKVNTARRKQKNEKEDYIDFFNAFSSADFGKCHCQCDGDYGLKCGYV